MLRQVPRQRREVQGADRCAPGKEDPGGHLWGQGTGEGCMKLGKLLEREAMLRCQTRGTAGAPESQTRDCKADPQADRQTGRGPRPGAQLTAARCPPCAPRRRWL